MIGIMSAISLEISGTLLERLDNIKTETGLGHDFHRGVLSGHEVVLTTSGIGKVRAAARTQYSIDHYGISKLIFVGIAGALNPRLKIGDIVISQQVIQHDFALSESTNIKKRGAHWYYGDSELIQAAAEAGQKLDYGEIIHKGKILTGDQPVHDQPKKDWLCRVFDGDCVEMEGAAVAMVCWMNKLPFVLIRGISDLADEKTNEDMAKSLPNVIERNMQLVIELVANLP